MSAHASDHDPQGGEQRPPPLISHGFDTFQRMAIIRAVCVRLVQAGCTTAIDVGGHPGLLADNLPEGLRCRAVIDLPHCRRPDHVQGSAMALPLGDDQVDVALSSDTLEHLADPVGAVHELARVARRAIVISAPWRCEAISQVEQTLNRWHQQLTGCPHPWLSEHIEHGLPDLGEVEEAIRGNGWSQIHFACGTLHEWTLLQTALLLHELLPAADVNMREFHEAHNRGWDATLSTHIPAQPYRTVLLAVSERSLLKAVIAGSSSAPPSPPPLEPVLQLIGGLLARLQETLSREGAGQGGFDAVYRERLESLTAQQAAEIEGLRAEIERLRGEGGLVGKARRALGRLGGRGERS
ncbi:methyltransferase domain-containing protein [Candidatus Sumerlaeota bacterium]|nr:methyltransferase domain-containing protein [Candidatus Sumerlaeota bacterium]